MLLKAGADPNIQAQDGWTATHIAAVNGYVDIVGILIAYGADVTIKTHSGRTPLHLAARKGRESVVLLLLSKGYGHVAEVLDSSALRLAEENGHTKVSEILGADLSSMTQ